MGRGKHPEPPPVGAGDDACPWQDEVSDVTPLGQPKPPGPTPQRLNRAQREALKGGPVLPPAPQLAAVPLKIVSNTAARLAGWVANFDLKLAKDLADGKVPCSAMMDLHGMYEGDAYLHLMNWLQEASHQDHRCVLVICGKGSGYGPARDMGLLKAQMAGWLANHPAVLAFHTAQPRDGGAGAVYVYLRRPR